LKLTAAICTNRGPDAVEDVLGPLAEQASAQADAEALLITSGVDAGTHAAHVEAAGRLGARIAPAGPSLSLARNRALQEAGDSEIVAFIDDDAVPDPQWLGNLIARWRDARPEVACIGGAIDPAWAQTPPTWVSPRIDVTFSLLDLGPGVVELDPERDLEAYGANVSFRTVALREVGGFDPTYGPWGGLPLYGDESIVQRRLARNGCVLLYAGDVRVAHQVSADRLRLRGLWRREHYRGASAGLRGDASPSAGLGGAVKASAGLAVALARRDAPLAGERFARVAREGGVVLSPLTRARLRRRGWPG